ncbi:MAG: hypothetical protein K0V04_19220 [Deltaproteobacteria bacterium]|nr:hypothetical protein [Deltaproteobacteria bacterium]
MASYSDKASISRVNRRDSATTANGVTQFGRALAELYIDIDIICARPPQARDAWNGLS